MKMDADGLPEVVNGRFTKKYYTHGPELTDDLGIAYHPEDRHFPIMFLKQYYNKELIMELMLYGDEELIRAFFKTPGWADHVHIQNLISALLASLFYREKWVSELLLEQIYLQRRILTHCIGFEWQQMFMVLRPDHPVYSSSKNAYWNEYEELDIQPAPLQPLNSRDEILERAAWLVDEIKKPLKSKGNNEQHANKRNNDWILERLYWWAVVLQNETLMEFLETRRPSDLPRTQKVAEFFRENADSFYDAWMQMHASQVNKALTQMMEEMEARGWNPKSLLVCSTDLMQLPLDTEVVLQVYKKGEWQTDEQIETWPYGNVKITRLPDLCMEAVYAGNLPLFAGLLEQGGIRSLPVREELQKRLREEADPEYLAAFMDWSHRTFDPEKDEKRRLSRDMNALKTPDPHSARYLRSIWSTEKLADSPRTEAIQSWKGSGITADVPARIGKAAIIALESRVFSTNLPRGSYNRAVRCSKLQAIRIAEGIEKMGSCCISALPSLELLILPKSMKYFDPGCISSVSQLKKLCLPNPEALLPENFIRSFYEHRYRYTANQNDLQLYVLKDSEMAQTLQEQMNAISEYERNCYPHLTLLSQEEMDTLMQEQNAAFDQLCLQSGQTSQSN